MSEKANLGIMKEAYAAFGRGDIPAVLSVEDSNTELGIAGPKEIPWAGSFRRHDGAKKYFAAIEAEADFDAFEPHTFLGTGRRSSNSRIREGPLRTHGPLIRESLGPRFHTCRGVRSSSSVSTATRPWWLRLFARSKPPKQAMQLTVAFGARSLLPIRWAAVRFIVFLHSCDQGHERSV